MILSKQHNSAKNILFTNDGNDDLKPESLDLFVHTVPQKWVTIDFSRYKSC